MSQKSNFIKNQICSNFRALPDYVASGEFSVGNYTGPTQGYIAGIPVWCFGGNVNVVASPHPDSRINQLSSMVIGGLVGDLRGNSTWVAEELGLLPLEDIDAEYALYPLRGVYATTISSAPMLLIKPTDNIVKIGQTGNLHKRAAVSDSCCPLPVHNVMKINPIGYETRSVEAAIHNVFNHRLVPGFGDKFNLGYFEVSDLIHASTSINLLIRYLQMAGTGAARDIYNRLQQHLVEGTLLNEDAELRVVTVQ